MADVRTPDWLEEAVFYQIFPDRFARSESVPKPTGLQPWGAPPTPHGYQGGDLAGVTERLDYLAQLGVNAIYFNPVFRSASNHRYHTHDYYQVDPMLGGNEALRGLIAAAHARRIRIVLDGVFNHASRGFFQFHDILENGQESAYLDWFHVSGWPLRPYGSRDPNYWAWWGNPALPKFNTNTPSVREFLWDVATYWIARGIDGWRLDVPGEIDDDSFWREFRRRVKAANPDAYIVGEIWGDASRWLQGDQFDAVMNYGVSRLALGFFGRETMDREYRPGGFRIPQLGARAFLNETERLLSAYAWPITLAQMNLLDSHDTSRFLTQAGHDRSALELSLTYLATLPGAPCIYYGTEVGMRGGPDPECRGAFLWDSDRWDRELLARTQRILALRREHPALRRGGFSGLYGHDDLVAYARESADETALVVINAAREARGLVLDVSGLLPDGIHHDLLQGLPAGVTHGNLRHLQLPPRAAAVFTAWRG